MSDSRLGRILADVASGRLTAGEAEQLLRRDFEALGFATVDVGRARRRGYPEVIFCQGKATEHIVEIARNLAKHKPLRHGRKKPN